MSTAQNSHRVRVREHTISKVGSDVYLLRTMDGRLLPLSQTNARAFALCCEPRTIAEHCSLISRNLGFNYGQLDDFKKAFTRAQNAGCVLSPADLVAEGLGRGKRLVAEPIVRIGIPTKDRPQVLERAIRSYAANARDAGREIEFVISCDSRDRPAAGRQREALISLEQELHVRLSYRDREDKLAYIECLAACANLPVTTVTFAVFGTEASGYTNGGNMNFLLLHGAGAPLITVDDDTLCRIYKHGDDRSASLGGTRSPLDLLPFADRDSLGDRAIPSQADFIGLSSRFLGSRLVDALMEIPRVDTAIASDEILDGLPKEKHSVAASWWGMYGDSGSAVPTHYLSLQGTNHAFLVQSEDWYRASRTSRLAIKCAPVLTFCRPSFFQSAAIALDARRLLPPFFPVFPAADVTFGQTLKAIDRTALLCLLPYAVGHFPVPSRHDPPDAIWKGQSGTTIQHLHSACIAASHIEERLGDPVPKIQRLGAFIEEMASADYATIRPLLVEHAVKVSQALATQIEAKLAGSYTDKTPTWRKDAQAFLAQLIDGLSDPEVFVPKELSSASVGAWAVAQDLLRKYGVLLQAWPTLFAAAAELRQQTTIPDKGIVIASMRRSPGVRKSRAKWGRVGLAKQ